MDLHRFGVEALSLGVLTLNDDPLPNPLIPGMQHAVWAWWSGSAFERMEGHQRSCAQFEKNWIERLIGAQLA